MVYWIPGVVAGKFFTQLRCSLMLIFFFWWCSFACCSVLHNISDTIVALVSEEGNGLSEIIFKSLQLSIYAKATTPSTHVNLLELVFSFFFKTIAMILAMKALMQLSYILDIELLFDEILFCNTPFRCILLLPWWINSV